MPNVRSRSQAGDPHSKIAFLFLCLLMAVAAPAQAQLSINTIPFWDGSTFISPFGVTDTATYGQTITVPAGGTVLNSFAFEVGNCSANVNFRGEVYAWNGTLATGSSLYESSPVTVNASSSYQVITFNTGGINLSAGTYVLFGSTSKDQTGAPSSSCRWGALPDTSRYPSGQFVYLNNNTNVGQWTSLSWNQTIVRDLAFSVNTSSSSAVPAASTTVLLIIALALTLLAIYSLMRTRRHT